MQINTRNPDGSGKRCNTPGANCPLPHQQNAPKGAPWSGLLECPCNFGGNTRMIKTFDHRTDTSACLWNSTVTIQEECFAAAGAGVTKNATADDAALPYGCSVSADGAVATFNTNKAKASCAGAKHCVCRAQTGRINGKRFDSACIGEPRSELIKTHNPTCDINLYDGGLGCCGGTDIIDGKSTNTRFLLDADQAIPALVDEASQRAAQRAQPLPAGTPARNGEYRRPPAPAGSAGAGASCLGLERRRCCSHCQLAAGLPRTPGPPI